MIADFLIEVKKLGLPEKQERKVIDLGWIMFKEGKKCATQQELTPTKTKS